MQLEHPLPRHKLLRHLWMDLEFRACTWNSVHGIPFLKQLERPLQSDLQPHLVSPITAWGAGRERHIAKIYVRWCSFQPFSLMRGRSEQLLKWDLSRMAMTSARMIAASHLPRHTSHSSKKLPSKQHTWQTNSSTSLSWVSSFLLANRFWIRCSSSSLKQSIARWSSSSAM